MARKEEGLVFALFENEAAADEAVESLRAWDKLDDDVKLNKVGTIVLDEHGKLKIHKVGRLWDAAKGVGGGAVAVILAGAIISPVADALILGLISAHLMNLRVAPEDRERLSAELANGRAAVAVLVTRDEVPLVRAKLTELGGSPEEPVTVEITPELDAAAAQAQKEADKATVS